MKFSEVAQLVEFDTVYIAVAGSIPALGVEENHVRQKSEVHSRHVSRKIDS